MSGTSGNIGVEDTLKDFWATRPRRPRHGRKIAGVAAALGDRYGIDPVIIRVAFVVAAFYGGAGILFYLLGWLLLAEEDDEVSPVEALHGRGRSSSSGPFTIALGAALIPAFWWFFDRDASGVLSVVVVLGLIFLLHRSRAHLGRPGTARAATQVPTYAPYPPEAAAQPTVVWDPIHPAAYGTEAQGPPAWDPLGAAPFAWDLPEPSSPEPEPQPPAPRRHKSRIGLVTVAVAFLTVGAAVVAYPFAGWLTVPHVIGVVLGILGCGLFAAAFAGGARGLIGLVVPLAFLGVAMTSLWPGGFDSESVGDINAKPVTISEVQDKYEKTIGSITLDLTQLPATADETVETKVEVRAGDVTVTVPKTADVTVKCSVGVGDVDCLGQSNDGIGEDVKIKDDYGPDGPGGLKIEIEAEVSGPGGVVVRRG
ncbi:PspC domain-containing protein [Alloactinosynnema sp. L-07]|uniref:PspC domain-containing protein n=1 Tax=Alloactinosynnema sp. L-07 TaxID=1653480 RepID=UPI001E3D4C1B|nr:PspC domain-containing protein [Alloactinosynnema sp. L-07]